MDERIKLIWLETSGTGMTDTWYWSKSYHYMYLLYSERYFNKITRNNQGNVNDNM